MLPLYTCLIFTSAFLLFLIQPMMAKLLLPILGGAPAVWNTAMVFYQILLLLGYIYTHFSLRLLSPRIQARLHAILLVTSLLMLPIQLHVIANMEPLHSPITWVLATLALSIGLPFFVLSANAPLTQRWFSYSNHARAKNPYFLYAASNVGSFLALLAYPIFVEPLLGLGDQKQLWSWLYGGFGCLLLATAWQLLRTTPLIQPVQTEHSRIDWKQRGYWVALAFIPSSLLLGVTSHITTDIASMPLLWTIPLALYLLTFVFAFGHYPRLCKKCENLHQPLVLLISFFIVLMIDTVFPSSLIAHLIVFFAVALSCHAKLAKTSPPAHQLTEFYVWMSLGGALGGVLNAILAPVLFNSIWEYPLALALSCLVVPATSSTLQKFKPYIMDIVVPLMLCVLAAAIIKASQAMLDSSWWKEAEQQLKSQFINTEMLQPFKIAIAVVAIGFSTAGYHFQKRPLRFAALIAAIGFCLPGIFSGYADSATSYRERSFFGVSKVWADTKQQANYYSHGTTTHGMQSLKPEYHLKPISYYGWLGEVFDQLPRRIRSLPMGVVGLGVGTLTCFAQKEQIVDIFEIDPLVEKIARDDRYFTYLRDCPAHTNVHIVDGRLGIAAEPEGKYGMLILDAYSSDSLPAHLMTREAVQMYLGKLAPGGLLIFHISNRHLNLAPILSAIAQNLNVYGVEKLYASTAPLALPAKWVLFAKDKKSLVLLEKKGWAALTPYAGRPWSDDYSNILEAMRLQYGF